VRLEHAVPEAVISRLFTVKKEHRIHLFVENKPVDLN